MGMIGAADMPKVDVMAYCILKFVTYLKIICLDIWWKNAFYFMLILNTTVNLQATIGKHEQQFSTGWINKAMSSANIG